MCTFSNVVPFLGFVQECSSCNRCGRIETSYQLDIVFSGHNAVTCLVACRHNEGCIFASYSVESGCRLSDTCNSYIEDKQDNKDNLYKYRFKKLGKK